MLEYSEACERNKDPILEILREELKDAETVLEIGSGTGQHAVYFARFMPHLTWYPSDVEDNIAAIEARLDLERGENIVAPRVLDVSRQPWPVDQVDAVFSANCLHIIGWPQVEDFFGGVGSILNNQGRLCVYGPFNYSGEYTSPSNEQFDGWLKQRDPQSGIRNFEAVDALARAQNLRLLADHTMPANNRLLVWRRSD